MRRKTTKIPTGPSTGKRITFAPTHRVDRLQRVAERFMLDVFDLDRCDYVISDESTLLDFADFDTHDTSSLWNRMDQLFALTKDDVPSERLVNILTVLAARKSWR